MRESFVVAVLCVSALLPFHAAATEAGLDKGHLVPVEKNLPEEWIEQLFERGEPTVYRGKDLNTIGMPVGGIAAGQLYLCGDGALGQWWIFNRHHPTGIGQTNYQYRQPQKPIEQGFAVIVERNGKYAAKTLDRDGFSDVSFTGEYPVGIVHYAEDGFPLQVELKAFSPFIPLDARDSALPATVFMITARNGSAEPVQAALLSWLQNAVCFYSAMEVAGLRRTRIVRDDGNTFILHSAQPVPESKEQKVREKIVFETFEGGDYGDWKAEGEAFGAAPAAGTLPGQQAVTGFEGKGLVNTFIKGDGPQGKLTSPTFKIERKHISFLLGGGNHPGETCINLLVDGQVVRTATGKSNELLEWRSWPVEELEGKTAHLEIVDANSGGWGHINIDQIEFTDEAPKGPPLDSLADYGTMALALAGTTQSLDESQRIVNALPNFKAISFDEDATFHLADKKTAGLLSGFEEIAPGESRAFLVVLAWHFPNHPSGRFYATRFDSAREVAAYVLDNAERLIGDTLAWHKTYYADSTLPHWLLERLAMPVSTLATDTCQWWRDGRFWAWEGVGCCGGTCTHVWNYEQAAGRLFPELERIVRERQDLGDALHENGLVGFRGGGAYAADGQAGTVLKCYREHTMSADSAFLKRNWPKIKLALDFCIAQDGNADGLIENSQHNTFDINFFGANTFIGSLYLAALKAGEAMAREVGDDEYADRVAAIAASGRRLSVERLWNGEYFIQDVDLEEHPQNQYATGCLSDQVFGQGWAHQLGLGYIYPEENVRRALESVWKYNWAPDVGPHNALHPPFRVFAQPGEAGLFTCTWPKSPHLEGNGVLYRNEVWTGIEYQVAGDMAWEGMTTEALAICRAIHERYHPSKRNPLNEVECGDHYARAMASWGVYTALCGYEYHGPKGHLGFAPKLTPDNFRAAFTAAGGWGSFAQKRVGASQLDEIELRWGTLRLKTLAFAMPAGIESPKVAVRLGDERLRASFVLLDDKRIRITLSQKLTLKAGEKLLVEIAD